MAIAGIESKDMNPTRDDFAALLNETLSQDDAFEGSVVKGKITAMSQEAKASAAIIGALPIIVMVLVYLTSPNYILLLFQTQLGNVILGCAAVWMFLGMLVMRKMINFDY